MDGNGNQRQPELQRSNRCRAAVCFFSSRAADTLYFRGHEVEIIVLNSSDVVGTLEPASYTAAVARMCPALGNL